MTRQAMFVRRASAAAVAIAVVSLPGRSAPAADRNWSNPAGGAFSTAGNWSPTTVPLADDRALFALPSTYTVLLGGNVTNAKAVFDAGDVTLNLGGRTYTASGSIAMEVKGTTAAPAAATMIGGTFQMTGLADIGSGTLTVGAGATFKAQDPFVVFAGLRVGLYEEGFANVVSGGNVAVDNLWIGLSGSGGVTNVAPGTVLVSGTGSKLGVTSNLNMGTGDTAVASFRAEAGAAVTARFFNVGFAGTSNATAVVTGAGTTATLNNAQVGLFGTGQWTIGGGAVVTCNPFFAGTGVLAIGSNNGGSGLLTIRDAGTRLTIADDLLIGITRPLNAGDRSTGTFRVVGGGPTITVGDDLMMGDGTPALSAVIDGTGLATIAVGDGVALAGSMEVRLDGFTPALGQQFDVLTAKAIVGSLALTGPDAARFALSQTGTRLSLVYVAPEPGTATLAGAAVVGLLARRGRSRAAR